MEPSRSLGFDSILEVEPVPHTSRQRPLRQTIIHAWRENGTSELDVAIKTLWKLYIICVALGYLSGCGGGGKNDNNNGHATPSAALTLAPPSVSIVVTEGTSTSFSTSLTLNPSVVSGDAYVVFEDPNDVVTNATLTATTATTATATFNTQNTLSVGTHTGVLNLYVCKDAACNTPYDTNPATLGYTITVNPAPPAAIITPSTIAVTAEVGDITPITLTAQVTTSVPIYSFSIADNNGLFSTAVTSTLTTNNTYTLDTTLFGINQPGTYSGTIYLYLCSAYVCSSSNDVPGSPVAVPYSITVTPMTLLDPVATATGLPEWSTYQGNVGHTGYVPVTLDPNKFMPRWNWSNPTATVNSGTNVLTKATTGSGKVVIASTGFATQSNQTYLYALNESTGAIEWQYNFGVLSRVNDPSVTDGRVFVASSGHSDTFMWSFDVDAGTFKYKTAFESQWERYLAPTVKNGYLYTNGGYFGGMYRFKEATGKLNWFANLEQYDGWSPSIDDNYAYAYTGDKLHAVNLSTGLTAFTLANTGATLTTGATPVLPGDGTALIVDSKSSAYSVFSFHLIRYDLNTRAELWRTTGSFGSDPAVAANVVYVLNTQSNALEAYRLSNGALLWSWSPSDPNEKVAAGFNLIVTNNLLFVGSTDATYAIDLITHQSVWSNPHTGSLSLSSNKMLYITSDTEIHAFSLD